jgi:flagellar basal-body rod protein FlgB
MFDLLSSNEMLNTMDKAMTVASRRMALVASDLANIDTPFYRAKDLPFHEPLQAMLDDGSGQHLPIARTHPNHFTNVKPPPPPFTVQRDLSSYERNDFNDVNLDEENVKLMKTQGVYGQATAFAQAAIKRVLTAVRDGGK